MKVNELAKELGVSSKELLEVLKEKDSKLKNQFTELDKNQIAYAKKHVKPSAKTKKETKVAVAQKEKISAALKKLSEKAAKKEAKEKEVKAAAKAKTVEVKKPVAPKPVAPKIEKPAVPAKPAPEIKRAPAKSVPLTSSPVAAKPFVAPKAHPEVKKQERPVFVPKSAPVVQTPPSPPPVQEKKPIKLDIPITVGNLANAFSMTPAELIKALISIGVFANINQLLNDEIVFKVAAELEIKVEKNEAVSEKIYSAKKEDPKKLKFRAPVVTMMGHVDHGKTSLLDAIRKTHVAAGEAGYITQHIGAYMVELPGKGYVTFLDTPGHEAFTAIRARGAHVTDMVVLVVAADDGIMPQTREAIDHARAAECPIIVAINKSDLPAANPQRVMTQLQKIELVPEEWGGKTICVKVSAKTGDGIDELLEMLLLQAEVMELRANPDCEAQGTVLEAKLTKGQGAVSTILVQRGTLHVGDVVVAGPYFGRVRAMKNDRGKNVKEARPSHAVEVLGLSGVPDAGELFAVVGDEKMARTIAEKRELELRERSMQGIHSKHMSLQELYSKIKEGQKELRLIIKADTQGSIEALSQMLEKSFSDKISVRIIHTGVGGLNESDVMLAVASDAILIGFHVKSETRAQEIIEKEGIDARFYSIIYEVVQDVQKALEGLLEPTLKEVVEGRFEIRKIFKSSKVGTIGGGTVIKGKISRNNPVRVIRDNIVVFEGKLASLKRFQDDAREVQEGFECGVAVQGFDGIQEKDIVESYRVDKIATKLV